MSDTTPSDDTGITPEGVPLPPPGATPPPPGSLEPPAPSSDGGPPPPVLSGAPPKKRNMATLIVGVVVLLLVIGFVGSVARKGQEISTEAGIEEANLGPDVVEIPSSFKGFDKLDNAMADEFERNALDVTSGLPGGGALYGERGGAAYAIIAFEPAPHDDEMAYVSEQLLAGYLEGMSQQGGAASPDKVTTADVDGTSYRCSPVAFQQISDVCVWSSPSNIGILTSWIPAEDTLALAQEAREAVTP